MNRNTFDKGMALLAATFSTEPSPERVRIYWRLFKDEMSNAEWDAAVMAWVRDGRFFPVPANLLPEREEKASSLALPDRWSCAHCAVTLNFPVSRERGYCGPCWRKIGGDAEDNRNEQDLVGYGEQRRRLNGPESVGDILRIDKVVPDEG